MSISITRYVDIVSAVGGADTVSNRVFGLRLFTTNQAIPAGAVTTVTELSDVQTLFGASSNEYKAASNYFGFVSKTVNSPKQMSFIRVSADGSFSAAVYGAVIASPAALNMPTGVMKAVFGAIEIPIAIALTGGTLAVQATNLQTVLRALAGAGDGGTFTPFQNCTVLPNVNGSLVVTLAAATIDTEGMGSFYFTNDTADGSAYDASTDAAIALGLDQTLAVEQDAADTVTDAATVYSSQISDSVNEDDNFGSFGVVPAAGSYLTSLTTAQITNIAAWNHAQNNKFMYLQGVTAATYAAVQAAVSGYSGTALTLVLATAPATTLDIFPEYGPGAILGAIDFDNPAASQNFMFYQFASYTPTVTSDADANTYDAVRVNYNGRTQQAGQKVVFYQRGMLQGLAASAAVDMTTYCGEMWLKDANLTSCLNVLLTLPGLPANQEGRATVLSALQTNVDDAITNGVISVGKTLTTAQQLYINQITGSSTAWRQVQSKGYWLDAAVESSVDTSGATVYSIAYTLIYSKNDQVRSITGRDIMI